MLSVPHQSIGFSFSSDLSLLTMKGIGVQYVDNHSYSWDNRNLKDIFSGWNLIPMTSFARMK